jgi:hypothetical protein
MIDENRTEHDALGEVFFFIPQIFDGETRAQKSFKSRKTRKNFASANTTKEFSKQDLAASDAVFPLNFATFSLLISINSM